MEDGDKSPEVRKKPGNLDENLVKGSNNRSISQILREKIGFSVRHLKYLYSNARSMGTKQKELKALVQSRNYDVIGIMETFT